MMSVLPEPAIVGKFVICKGTEPALFPGIARAANGDLLVSYCTRFDCLPGGTAYLLRSRDGSTWSAPTPVLESRKPDGCINLSVGLTTLRDGTVLYPCCDARITRKWDQHEADLVILRSEDDGFTWSEPRPIAIDVKEPFAYGRVIELENGDVICPIWGKRHEDEPWRSGLLRSQDGGRTWGEHVTIAYDSRAVSRQQDGDPTIYHAAGFNETSLVELPGGRLFAVLRQQGVGQELRRLFRCFSYDQGHTWSRPQPLPLWGTSPSLHLTATGFLLLGYRNHLGNPQGLDTPGVGISVSADEGRTWTAHRLLEDPQGFRYRHEFDAGYPAFLDMDGARTLSLFYSFDPDLTAERYLAANLLDFDHSICNNR